MNDQKHTIEITPEMKAAHEKIHAAIGAPELTQENYAKGAFAALSGSTDPLGISSALVDDLRTQIAELTAQVAQMQRDKDMLADELYATAAVFDFNDTIGGEPLRDYVARMVKNIRKELEKDIAAKNSTNTQTND